MPKLIENLPSRLLAEAKRQIEESGYAAMTIRSVATACGIGVGTLYNYFPSKDAMLATYMLEDWRECVAAIEAASAESNSPKPVVHCIFQQLHQYAGRHQSLFRDEVAAASFAGSFGKYHGLLRGQLAGPLKKFCASEFTAEFVAEALLTWTMAGKGFEEIYGMIEKLF